MTGTSPAARRWPVPSRFQLVLTGVLVAAVAGLGTIALLHRAAAGPGAAGSQSREERMGLTPAGGVPAPALVLADQTGRTVSLAGLSGQGQVVVLEFMDSHCTDICPIISQEFRSAYNRLGADASHVAFVAVNVNPFHTSRADVASFTDEQGLDQVPTWHFLTGSVPQLRQAWKAYGVAVQAPSPTADVVHSDNIYFIDATGHERWIALPTDDHTASGTAYLPAAQVQQWGDDIASVARQLAG